jgi:hypothetical protein
MKYVGRFSGLSARSAPKIAGARTHAMRFAGTGYCETTILDVLEIGKVKCGISRVMK